MSKRYKTDAVLVIAAVMMLVGFAVGWHVKPEPPREDRSGPALERIAHVLETVTRVLPQPSLHKPSSERVADRRHR